MAPARGPQIHREPLVLTGIISHRVSSSRKRLLPKTYRAEGTALQLKVIRTVSAVDFAPECRAQSGSNSHRSFFEYATDDLPWQHALYRRAHANPTLLSILRRMILDTIRRISTALENALNVPGRVRPTFKNSTP